MSRTACAGLRFGKLWFSQVETGAKIRRSWQGGRWQNCAFSAGKWQDCVHIAHVLVKVSAEDSSALANFERCFRNDTVHCPSHTSHTVILKPQSQTRSHKLGGQYTFILSAIMGSNTSTRQKKADP
jgi:hypothetical protein